MKLKDISRTATFAWDQSSSSSPLLATGAVAGALDESFSNESQLEIWSPDFGEGQGMHLGGQGKGAAGSITVNSRFNRLAWSAPTATNARGVLAAGMETGEISVYTPDKILAGASADEARIFTNNKHTGPVRGLDFNPIQKNLMLSGAINAELYIFDLNNPTSPIAPGALSTKLNEITSLQWNPTVSRVFAASSSSGYTSVWDLKAQKEIVSLQYGGGAAKGMDTVGAVAGLQMGKRRGMSDVCWHPEQATRLITASEDDESPIIMLWDLRNTRAPERWPSEGSPIRVLVQAGCRSAPVLRKRQPNTVLEPANRRDYWRGEPASLALLTCQLPASSDWSFQTTWCPRNPDLLATASFDGHIGIHSLQTTHVPEPSQPKHAANATADDIFGALGEQAPAEQEASVLSLKQPPKWLRRPVSATFGYGGLLASTSNLPGASGKHQSGVVHLHKVVTESSIVERGEKLHAAAGEKEALEEFCNSTVSARGDAAWKTLQTLFKANSKEELVQLLGFSKADVARQVEEAVKKFPSKEETVPASTPASAKLDDTPTTEEPTEKSLFDDEVPGTPTASGADFFSSMSAGQLRNPLLENIIPHKAQVAESSVAATVGSAASSVRSESLKQDTFHIYPSGESEVDRLVTQALVVGDFQSAVELCLASERFADALLLAVRGGPDLLQSTQKAYFAKRTTSLPFLRVFQSIVTEDLADIVQNADLGEWKVAFVVLCTFAKEGEFNNLADQLGQRLQFLWQTLSVSDGPDSKSAAKTAREDATLCYLAARRLEKVVPIWIDEMREEEEASDQPRYTAHGQALQSFIEKVAVFTAATGYVDSDLASPTQSAAAAEQGARTYRLAGLYDRFYEYADLLATQGLVDIAAKYVQMTPADYKGTGAGGGELDKARDRLLQAASVSQAPTPNAFASSSRQRAAPVPAAYAPVAAPVQPAPAAYAPSIPAYQEPAPASNPAPQTFGGYSSDPYAPTQSYQSQPQTQNQYGTSNNYMDPQPHGYGAPPTQTYGQSQNYGQPPSAAPPLAPPPRANANGNSTPPIPAALRRDIPGWNDAPAINAPKRPQSTNKDASKPAPIMSPFPNSDALMNAPHPGPPSMTPPPVRAGQPGMLPPPPKGGPRPPSAQAVARQAMPPPGPPRGSMRGGPPPGSSPGLAGPPPGAMGGPPPPRALSPLGPGRDLPPMTSQFQQQPPRERALSPPGPGGPPPGVRAGPPPPGRVSSVPPAAPPAQVKPKHPAGDRSHISPQNKPIFDTLSAELSRVKQLDLPVHVKKIVDDTERRLNILFDGLNNDTVPKVAADQMQNISKAIAARDANAALAMHVELLTNSTGDMSSWAVSAEYKFKC